ncbi:sulfotransferase family cytosolic 1B member 1-like [Pecten maximus]|uniref:sulfotransferase family cytosolic 1B member 1-like n=1 Tax=Pecten maximus TaxID=6579 RepID=UPI0014589939|nr:sulfotransferase family cytosolic 1B member 1-like [Pecten maximus]
MRTPKSWSYWLNAFSKRQPLLYGGWFNYEKEFDSAKASGKLTNVFTIEFEELKRNPIPILRGLAKFLDVDLTDETLIDINKKCSFENLSTSGTQVKDNTDIIAESRDGSNFFFGKGS